MNLNIEENLYFGEMTLFEYKLLELPDMMVNCIQKNYLDFRLKIKGNSDKVVLCNSNQTVSVVKVHLSNCMLLKEVNNEKILQNLDCYYETKIKSSGIILMEVYQLLKTCSYHNGTTNESEIGLYGDIKMRGKNNYTFEMIDNEILGSKQQIIDALTNLGAFQLPPNGYWKLLDPEIEKDILNLICILIQESQWDMDRIDGKAIVKELSDQYDMVSCIHCMKKFAKGFPVNYDNQWNFDINKIAKYQAVMLFNDQDFWMLDEFLNRWGRIVKDINESFKVNIKILYGICVVIDHNQVKYLNENHLPIDIKERLSNMFNIKKRWNFEEIKPYVINYSHEEFPVERVLSKYAKVSRPQGNSNQRFYLKK